MAPVVNQSKVLEQARKHSLLWAASDAVLDAAEAFVELEVAEREVFALLTDALALVEKAIAKDKARDLPTVEAVQ